ncbi:MAG TPA: apolipoprotein N-acyltransferase [Geminicoccaceae bacterium]|nr:apolipoprotein N-acyltransferase [Geminicoccaceae bacterium]
MRLGMLKTWPGATAWALGMLAALALPPVHFLPGLLGFAGLLHLARQNPAPWRLFRLGWSFGFGWFLAGLYWVAIAFLTDVERFGPFAIPAVLALTGGLALLPGLALLASGWRRWRSVAAQALVFAAAWTVAEIVRGDVGLRFPWNPVALVWAVSDGMLQSLAWLGTWGLSLVTVAAAALPAALLERGGGAEPAGRRQWRAPLAGAVALLALWGGGSFRLPPAAAPPDGLRLRVVQANVAQHHKWDPELRLDWFRRHLQLSTAPGGPVPELIVWPESAVPYQIEEEPVVRDAIAQVVPENGLVLAGGDRYELEREPPVAFNSLFALDGTGTVRGRYDKVDLVPFGEFMPFRAVFGAVGLKKLTEGTIDFVPGPGRRTVALDGIPPFSPLICYEVIFPGRATADGDRPAWLLTITNDAWFGTSSGPYQHLAMARMRAVEEGLPLVRAANTGISVVTDAYGRVLASLALNETGVIDSALPPALPAATPARRWGPPITALLLLAALALALLLERRAAASARTAQRSGSSAPSSV